MFRIFAVLAFTVAALGAAIQFTPLKEQVATVFTSSNTSYTRCTSALNRAYPNHDWTLNSAVAQSYNLDDDTDTDYIFKLVSSSTCGTVGCVFQICLNHGSETKLLPFNMAGQKLTPKGTRTAGMRDLQLTTSDTINLNWNGTRYTITQTTDVK